MYKEDLNFSDQYSFKPTRGWKELYKRYQEILLSQVPPKNKK